MIFEHGKMQNYLIDQSDLNLSSRQSPLLLELCTWPLPSLTPRSRMAECRRAIETALTA